MLSSDRVSRSARLRHASPNPLLGRQCRPAQRLRDVRHRPLGRSVRRAVASRCSCPGARRRGISPAGSGHCDCAEVQSPIVGATWLHVLATGRWPAPWRSARVSGVSPYVDGYVQLGRRPAAIRLGARLGLPALGWHDHQVYARYDIPVTRSRACSSTSGCVLTRGTPRTDASTGSFLGVVQGVGLQIEGTSSMDAAWRVVAAAHDATSYGSETGRRRRCSQPRHWG